MATPITSLRLLLAAAAVTLQLASATVQPWTRFEVPGKALPHRGSRLLAEDYPHQAAVLMYRNPNDVEVCGGSLVAPQWVLTSAACLNKCADGDDDTADCNDYFLVLLGAQFLRQDEDSQQSRMVVQVELHPEYQGDVKSDIALLKLDTPADITESVEPVALPTPDLIGVDLKKTDLILSGYGTAKDESSPSLRVTTVSGDSLNLICKLVFVLHKLEAAYHFCGRQVTCAADFGGSPLVTRVESNNNNAPTLVQLALSSGAVTKQCDRVLPSLFLRLDPYVDWIRNVTGLSA